MSVVQQAITHTSLTKEMVRVAKQPKVTIICEGRKEPSKAALDRFIEIYKEIVADNERKEASGNDQVNQKIG